MMKRAVYITLTVVVVISAMLLCTSCLSIYSYDNGEKYTAGGASISEAVTEIDIGWVNGNVKIEVYDGEEIVFNEETDGVLETQKQLHYFLDGTTLYLQYAKSGIRSTSLDFGKKDLTVMIPKDRVYDLSIESVSSDINIIANNFDELEIETVSGYTSINMNSAEMVELNTVSGNVSLSLQGMTAAEIYSVSGNIELYLNKENSFYLDHETVSGNLNISFETITYEDRILYSGETPSYEASGFEIETVSGNIDISPLSK